MAWGTVTSADVEAHLNVGELADYRKHSAEVADPLPTVIADVIGMARAYVGARYSLQATGIPSALRIPVIDLIIHQLAKRIRKGGGNDDDDRAKAADRALEMLKGVGKGDISLGEPADESAGGRGGNWGSAERFASPAEDQPT